MEYPANVRTAMRELARGRELMTELSSLLEGTSLRVNDEDRSELVGVFYGRVMKAFDTSISLVESVGTTTSAAASPVSVLHRDDAHRDGSVRRRGTGDPNPRSQVRRRVSDSKTTVTDSPFGDGYQWRKYGQKTIRNVKYPRSYYKCTHTGCEAKLQVQQTVDDDSGSLPLYEVTRNNEHTCSTTVVHLSAVEQEYGSSGPPRGAHIITFESGEPVPGYGGGPTSSQLASPAAETGARDDNYSVFLPPPSPVGPFYGVDATYY